MIDVIAYELVNSIAPKVNFFDTWAGMVRPMRKKVQNVEKVFPVTINLTSNCDYSDYIALVPDSSKKSVAYIEKIQSPNVETIRYQSKQMTAQLRLVVWYNLDRITAGAYVSEDVLVDQVLSAIPKSLPDSIFNGVKQVHIEPINILYGADIVSQYTYNEVKTQFVTHPYGIFAIDMDITYIVYHCQPEIPNESSCGNGFEAGKGNVQCYPGISCIPDPEPPVLVETDPIVGAIDGIVKSDGSGNISAAVGGVDFAEALHTHDGVYLKIESGTKSSAIDAGYFGQISFDDDYAYVCVVSGTAGNATWKKTVLFNT